MCRRSNGRRISATKLWNFLHVRIGQNLRVNRHQWAVVNSCCGNNHWEVEHHHAPTKPKCGCPAHSLCRLPVGFGNWLSWIDVGDRCATQWILILACNWPRQDDYFDGFTRRKRQIVQSKRSVVGNGGLCVIGLHLKSPCSIQAAMARISGIPGLAIWP